MPIKFLYLDLGKVLVDFDIQRMLDQILTELLARASGYGFSLDEVLEGLRQLKEDPS